MVLWVDQTIPLHTVSAGVTPMAAFRWLMGWVGKKTWLPHRGLETWSWQLACGALSLVHVALSPWNLILHSLSRWPGGQLDSLDFVTAWSLGPCWKWKLSVLLKVRLGTGPWLVPIVFCWSEQVRGPFRFKEWGKNHLWPSSQPFVTPCLSSLPCRGHHSDDSC